MGSIDTPRLYRKPCGTYFLRVIVSAPVSSPVRPGRHRKEVRFSLRTKDPSRARAIAAWANARLEMGRGMSNRNNILDALGIRQMLRMERGSITVETAEDADNLVRILNAHPYLPQALMPRYDPEVEARIQMMMEVINRGSPNHEAKSQAGASASSTASGRPPNPMPMSIAIQQYREGKLASSAHKSRTAEDQQRLLKSLAAHVVAADPTLGPDPHVHDIGTHHLTAFLNQVAATRGRSRKGAASSAATSPAAAPNTMKKKLSDLSTFFGYAHSQLQASLVNPTVALDGRRKDLNAAAARKTRHYKPFSNEQLARIFEPREYLSFNRQADFFWAPLLALHLGARLGELVTLPLAAIQQQPETGIWFLKIDGEAAKNANSERTVPISQQLVRLGFINYVRHLHRIGASQLFPHRDMTTKTATDKPSKNCSGHFNAYLAHLGLKETSADLVFHSFRHLVVQALQDNGTPLMDSMQLVGHVAQEHALKSGQLTAKAVRSAHLNSYMHPGEVRLNVDNPLARLKGHLDHCIALPLDYLRLRRAAYLIRRRTRVEPCGRFKSGWSILGNEAAVHLARLK